jgi:hypothetical protein
VESFPLVGTFKILVIYQAAWWYIGTWRPMDALDHFSTGQNTCKAVVLRTVKFHCCYFNGNIVSQYKKKRIGLIDKIDS